ncbi:hypothetical protein TNCV_3741171 [Trichonephila clavipes]|nr:hypothetical protein TNCV_3741171 [Trichonephila clavipes]
MHTCTPKYYGVLSSDSTPLTYDREKTQRLDTCEPETPSAIWGVRKKPPLSKDHRVQKDFVKNTEENGCVASSLTNYIF